MVEFDFMVPKVDDRYLVQGSVMTSRRLPC